MLRRDFMMLAGAAAATWQACGNRYLYAGLGTSLPAGAEHERRRAPGEGPVLQQDDLTTYRRLARREDPFGVLQARNLRSKPSQL
jgi:7,8-dihydropterin-6-yl-methyl-4-(beta-D-ribofuranosyl)aminobenzene 5'-phosphate synthase